MEEKILANLVAEWIAAHHVNVIRGQMFRGHLFAHTLYFN